MRIRIRSGPRSCSRTIVALLGVALVAGGAWAAPASEDTAAVMEREMVIDPTTGMEVPAPQYGGTLTAANDRQIANTDQSIGGLSAGFANSGVVEKLGIANWGIDRSINPLSTEYLDVSHYAGALAQSWEIPNDTTFMFTVRENARWHDKAPMNGRALTAEEIVFNFQRLSGTGPFEEPPPNSSLMPQLDFKTIEARGDQVYIELNTPRLDALQVFLDDNFGFILPPEVIKEKGDVSDWRTLVGTGPFMLIDWVDGDSLTFNKNPDYWGRDAKYPDNQLPYIDELRVLIMPETATYIAALRSGRVDYIGHNMSTHLSTIDEADSLLRTNPELRANKYYFRSNQVFALYVQDKPFDDVRVRRAMQMALDNETIAATVFKGQALSTPQGVIGRALTDYIVPFEEWPEELQHAYSYDPEAAEALLDEAGYPRGADGVRFKVPVQLQNNYVNDYLPIAKEYWRAIGVEVVDELMDGAEFVSRLGAGQLFGLTPFISGTPYPPLTSLQWQEPGHTANRGQFNDPVYNDLLANARAATTLDELKAAAKEADYYLIQQHWYTWGPIAPNFNFSQPWVQGFNGDFYSGVWQKNQVFARLWIDQALKAEMGF